MPSRCRVQLPPRSRVRSPSGLPLPLVLLRGGVVVAGLMALTACGGGEGPTEVQNCTTNPSLPQCQHDTTPPAPTYLKALASAHGLWFGTALDQSFYASSSIQARYDSLVAAEFNEVTPGNFMKWGVLNRDSRFTYRWSFGDSLVSFAQNHGMKVRGHTLAWHSQNPGWLTTPSPLWAPDSLRRLLKEHIDSALTHYKGRIYAWDVVNEAYSDGSGSLRTGPCSASSCPIWADSLGEAYIDTAFAEARRADPSALLFYNDYNIETAGAKQDAAFALAQRLKAKNLIDGIGFQGHLLVNADGTGAPTRDQMIASFQRFTALGLKVHVTELDVRVPTGASQAVLDKQAQVYGDVVSACRAVTGCEMIVVWGVLDSESWIPSTFPGWGSALLWDGSWNKKATYTAVVNALQ